MTSNKWADYLVVGIRYSPCGSHIDALQIVEDMGSSVGSAREVTRRAVVDAIHRGVTFCSATRDAGGKYVKGAAVEAYKVATLFLKTAPDATERDNLDHLPRF